jgi:ubiquinone/menaquinone biosynthesis C-methylase UbiE
MPVSKLLSIVTPLHTRTKRNYIARMTDEKIHCMKVAKKYGFDYWDGDRRYGYGGYRYDGRWKIVAQKLIKKYKLKKNARILDVGCGKAHLLYEFKRLLPNCTIAGIDISRYGINHALPQVKKYLKIHKAQDHYPFTDNYFDLVVSLNTFHNLKVFELEKALKEVQRVGKNKYIVVESYRNEKELFNLQCWALTCEAFFSKDAWEYLYKHFGYTGDYEFIYFE